MGWLSTTFGIILLTLLFTIWISAHPRWDQVAKEVASKMNYNEPDRIQKATKAAKKAETKIYDFYVRKLENQKKVAAREILDNAYFETVHCIKTFYEGGMELQFNDCMQHVIDLHIGRLKSLLQITTERYSSGASRLNIWHW